jgi:hypothetical protein
MNHKIYLSCFLFSAILIIMSSCAVLPIKQSTGINETSPGSNIAQATPNPIRNPVVISRVDSENNLETIYVTNISIKMIDITGYTLYSPKFNAHINFPKTVLQPGESLTITNGPLAEQFSEGLFWLDEITLEKKGDYLVLLNLSGRAIWYYTK